MYSLQDPPFYRTNLFRSLFLCFSCLSSTSLSIQASSLLSRYPKMGSANKHKQSKRPPPQTQTQTQTQNPTTSSENEEPQQQQQNPNPNPDLDFEEDAILSKSDYLTRKEVIKRRCRRLKMELKVYEDYYWSLMEDFRGKHREYYWNYGKSPVEDEEDGGKRKGDNNGVDHHEVAVLESSGGGSGEVKMRLCSFDGCKTKAMALTDYCHPHILNDANQKLYKACTYLVHSSVPQTAPVHCGKPILRATVPSLCSEHFGVAQTHVTRALRKAGLNISSSSKLAPKFHVIVAESVRQINARRRERKSNVSNDAVMEENANVGSVVVEESAG